MTEPVQRQLFGQVVIETEVLRQILLGVTMVLIMQTRPAGLWPRPRHKDYVDPDKDITNSTDQPASPSKLLAT